VQYLWDACGIYVPISLIVYLADYGPKYFAIKGFHYSHLKIISSSNVQAIAFLVPGATFITTGTH